MKEDEFIFFIALADKQKRPKNITIYTTDAHTYTSKVLSERPTTTNNIANIIILRLFLFYLRKCSHRV